jgi:hypothetical protein
MADKSSATPTYAPAAPDRRESSHSTSGLPATADYSAVAAGGGGGGGYTRSQSALKKIGNKLGFRKKPSLEDAGEAYG